MGSARQIDVLKNWLSLFHERAEQHLAIGDHFPPWLETLINNGEKNVGRIMQAHWRIQIPKQITS
jgi:hypothetical protein